MSGWSWWATSTWSASAGPAWAKGDREVLEGSDVDELEFAVVGERDSEEGVGRHDEC